MTKRNRRRHKAPPEPTERAVGSEDRLRALLEKHGALPGEKTRIAVRSETGEPSFDAAVKGALSPASGQLVPLPAEPHASALAHVMSILREEAGGDLLLLAREVDDVGFIRLFC